MQPSIPWSSSVSVFVIERTAIIHSLKCAVLFSLVVPLLSLAVTHCNLLSLVVLLVVTLYHLLHHSLSLVVIRCHSLSFVVTRCLWLSLDVPLVCFFINDLCKIWNTVCFSRFLNCTNGIKSWKRLIYWNKNCCLNQVK